MSTEQSLRTRDQSTPEKMEQRATVAPPVDIFESKDELLIVADLPGVAKEDVSVHLDKGQLTIVGRPRELARDEEPYDFRRAFVVPQNIEADKIAADLQNGVLRVKLPKPVAPKPRTIEVRSV